MISERIKLDDVENAFAAMKRGDTLLVFWGLKAALRFSHTGVVEIACTFVGHLDTLCYIMVIAGTLRMDGRLMPNVLRSAGGCMHLGRPNDSNKSRTSR